MVVRFHCVHSETREDSTMQARHSAAEESAEWPEGKDRMASLILDLYPSEEAWAVYRGGALGHIALHSHEAVQVGDVVRDGVAALVEEAGPRLSHEHLQDADGEEHVDQDADAEDCNVMDVLRVRKTERGNAKLLVGGNEN